MKLERQNRSKEDVVSKEIFYMIKRVSIFNNEKSIDDFLFSLLYKKESARQKKVGSTEEVEEVTSFILDHFNFIKNWVVQQAHTPTEPDKAVSCREMKK